MNLARLVDSHPADSVALIDGAGSMTYGRLRCEAARFSSRLAAEGIVPGDRVALACGQDRSFVSAYLGALAAGAICAPLNPLSPEAELAAELAVLRPSFVISDGRARLPEGSAILEAGAVTGDQSSAGLDGELECVERQAGDAAVLLFTSGTAGSPKAAILTHGSLHANLLQIQSHPGRQALRSDIGLGVLPLFHVFGLNVVLNLSLLVGGALVLAEGVDESLEVIARHGVTLVAGVPVLFEAWARSAGPRSDALRSVRMAISGAAPLDSGTAAGFEEAFSIPLWQGYGLTEASPVVTSPVMEGRPIPGSVGVPLPGVEVRVVDSSGRDALVGDTGELWVKGSNVFAGYFGDDEATSRVLSEGWLRTGDIAVADGEGRLYLVDRKKDLIIVSGFNVYPQEVEKVIAAIPGVAAAAAVGAGERESVVAYVVLEPGASVSADKVVAACRSSLAAYKCPARVVFVDDLPRAASGEVMRRALAGSAA